LLLGSEDELIEKAQLLAAQREFAAGNDAFTSAESYELKEDGYLALARKLTAKSRWDRIPRELLEEQPPTVEFAISDFEVFTEYEHEASLEQYRQAEVRFDWNWLETARPDPCYEYRQAPVVLDWNWLTGPVDRIHNKVAKVTRGLEDAGLKRFAEWYLTQQELMLNGLLRAA
jgi:hypothetical protein